MRCGKRTDVQCRYLARRTGDGRDLWEPNRTRDAEQADVDSMSILTEVRPPTGEPDAGDPHVRFGGRGSHKLSLPLSNGSRDKGTWAASVGSISPSSPL